jgi:hypothetical protein
MFVRPAARSDWSFCHHLHSAVHARALFLYCASAKLAAPWPRLSGPLHRRVCRQILIDAGWSRQLSIARQYRAAVRVVQADQRVGSISFLVA